MLMWAMVKVTYDIWLDVKRECIDQTSESGEAEPLQ